MEYKKYREITINGNSYTYSQLEKTCSQKISSSLHLWEKDIWQFITEWINDNQNLIVKTSGSTGQPKKIAFLKDQMVISAQNTAKRFGLKNGNRVLLCLPTEYIAGKMMIVRAFVCGLHLITTEPNLNPAKKIESKIDFAAMMPYQFQNSYRDNPKNLNNIKILILGGMKVNSEIALSVSNVSCKVFETYGMTETLTHVAVREIGSENTFKALPSITFHVDSENCLQIKADFIFNEALQTNDVVELISPFEFKLIGRRDHIINSGGIKLYPEQLEEKIAHLIECPYFITGVVDSIFGEKPILITEKKGTDIKLKDLIPLYSKYERPAQIQYVKKILFTKSGKVDRSKTKKKYNLF